MALASLTPASADQVFGEDVIVNGAGSADQLCLGDNCVENETFPSSRIKLMIKDDETGLEFQDINSDDHDWTITTNRDNHNNFRIENRTSGETPFGIVENAPSSSLVVGRSGHIGLGTGIPRAPLHIASGVPYIRIDDTSYLHSWQIDAGRFGFFLTDRNANTQPLFVDDGAPGSALTIRDTGNIGLGTFSPQGKLHTEGDGHQIIYFESADANAVQVRFRSDSENRRILAVDNDDNVKTQMQFKDDAIVFLGETVAQEWLRVDATGIITAGPTCGSPCDAVFDPEAFEVPDIQERAAQMWEAKHLPAIGPTKPGAPINLTEKMGGVIHELEVAHIYIEKLHERLEAQKTRKASLADRVAQQASRLAEQTSRNAALEACLDALEAQIRPHGD
ncbi:hypothetical protein DZK27_05420 [Rhodobacteraceae bacterium 63075]|nr:hypothetical protein DZK27_05420 [Rhodobacteraceae bacterium 63075]